MDVGWYLLFVEHRAPGHIAGIDGLRPRQELRAHRGADAVGADQQIAALTRAVGKDGGDRVAILFDLQQRPAEPIIFRRQRVAQSAVEPCPAAHRPRRWLRDDGIAGAVEADDLGHFDAHRLVEGDAGAAQNRDKLRMCAEADAAARQFFVIAFEDDGVPADTAKKMRRDQAAQRAADHQRAAHYAHPLCGEGLGAGGGRSGTRLTTAPKTCRRGRACNPYWSPPDCD
jgi:hypothetical protein